MEVVKYDLNEAEIAKMSSIYMSLTIKDLEDKEGLDAVHAGRMVMVKHRTSIDKLRKRTNEDAQTFIKTNNANAKKLLGLIEPIETHLKGEESKITKEKERIKAEEAAKEKERNEKRVSELFALNVNMPFFDLAMLSEDKYLGLLQSAKMAYEAEQLRLAEERKAKEAEEKKLAEERAELEKVKKEQTEKEEKLVADREAIEAEKQAIRDKKDREAFEKETKIQAEKDAKEKVEREANEKKDKEEAELAETVRQEGLRPIKDRIHDYANDLLNLRRPEFEDVEAIKLIQWAVSEITDLSARIKIKADLL